MKKDLIRTGKTELSDDELILFDVLFETGGTSVNSLRQRKFKEYFNFAYAHKLNKKALELCLEDLHSRELVKITTHKHRNKLGAFIENYVSITSKGLKIWEKEREPCWEKYCIGSTSYPEGNSQILEISSLSLDVIEKYLKIAQKINLFEFTKIENIHYKVEPKKSIIGCWEKFAKIHTATVTGEIKYYERGEEVPWQDTDWKYYFENLEWWGNIHELNILKKKINP